MSWHSASRNDVVYRDWDSSRASAEPRQRHRACHSRVEAFLELLVTDEGSEDSRLQCVRRGGERKGDDGLEVWRMGESRGENALQAITGWQSGLPISSLLIEVSHLCITIFTVEHESTYHVLNVPGT